jgi:hypothetical protein
MKSGECTKSQAALGDDRSLPERHPRRQLSVHYAACRRLRSIPEDEELSLAPKWATLPRAGVAAGLAVSGRVTDREVAALIQT